MSAPITVMIILMMIRMMFVILVLAPDIKPTSLKDKEQAHRQ
jgi:hypothetical protein